MAGQQLIERQSSKPSRNKSHGKNKNKVWPKILREKPRGIERKVLPKTDSQIQPRCAHVLRTASDLKSPTTRAPTRTPSGETGSEGSWLRVAQWTTRSANKSIDSSL